MEGRRVRQMTYGIFEKILLASKFKLYYYVYNNIVKGRSYGTGKSESNFRTGGLGEV
jgi:hypothetical protein